MAEPTRPEPDDEPLPALWSALGRGARLRAILEDFYAQVYADPRLKPFFIHTTMEWAIDHQYAFLASAFGGESGDFGDRPRNAHHWMVISHELFDYREALMDATLRRHGLSDELIAQWRAFEEKFRTHIVKDAPIAKKRRGMALPLDGHEPVVMDEGGICDGCEGILERGATALYHVRTGKAYCAACLPQTRESPPNGATT